MTSDIVTLPSGAIITRGRAIALGMLDEDGNLKSNVEPDSAAAQVLAQDARRLAWDVQQGIAGELAAAEAEKERVRIALGGEPAVTEDGLLKPKRQPKVARPRNVTKDGEPVTDEETLAKIAAQTAAIEAAKRGEDAFIVPTPEQAAATTVGELKDAGGSAPEGLPDDTVIEAVIPSEVTDEVEDGG